MPRHHSDNYAWTPFAERPPVYLTPEPVWVLDSYRVKRWYYRTAPKAGDKVMYLQDGFGTRIKRVTPIAIYFDDATVMRRPFIGRRLVAWSLPRLRTLTTKLHFGTPTAADRHTRQPQTIVYV